MAVKTGATAELRLDGVAIAKVRDVSVTFARDALETTGIGSRVTPRHQGTTAAVLCYDSADTATRAIINRLLSDESTTNISIVLDTSSTMEPLQAMH